jgi:hypothetical protein
MDPHTEQPHEKGYERPQIADYGDIVEITATNQQNLLSDVSRVGTPPPNQGFST